METSARELWRAWRRDRDGAAFERLVRSEIRYAADLARRLGASHAEAEDLVQESLLLLARESSDTPIEVGVRAWLGRRVVLGHKMAIRSAVRRRRRERRPRPVRTPPAPGRRLEIRDEVERALRTLDGESRRAVVLRYLHDLDYGEVAYVLGITVNASRIRVHRGLKRLRERLGSRAPALIGVIVIPAVPAEKALLASAVSASAKALAAGASVALAAKVAALVVGIAAAGTGVLALRGGDGRPGLPPAAVLAPPPPVKPPVTPPDPVPTPRPPRPASEPSLACLDLLDAHLDGSRDATRTMWRFDEVARLVGESRGPVLRLESAGSVTDVDLRRDLGDAEILELGPGIFRVVREVDRDRGRPLLIRGAGRDRTTLLAPRSDVVDGRRMPSLVVRDLTFMGEVLTGPRYSGLLLGVRGRTAAVFERIRFRSWSTTAGFGAPVGIAPGGRALLAFRDCEFIGAYRKRAGGEAVSLRGDGLVLLDRCTFSDLDEAVILGAHAHEPLRGLVHFRDCVFEGTRAVRDDRRGSRAPPVPVRVDGGKVSFGRTHDPDTGRWRRFGIERIEITSRPRLDGEPALCTLTDIRRVLEGLPAPRGTRIVGVEALTWRDAPEARYVVHLERDAGVRESRLYRLAGRRVLPAGVEGWRVPDHLPFRPGAGPDLLSLILSRWHSIDPATAVGGVAIHGDTAGRATLEVFDRRLRRVP